MNTPTKYEIDFLPVGDGDTSGDAIAIRYSDGIEWKVMVYDGGTKASGQALVDHINTYYGTSHVDFLVNSHPDQDHASGLSVVLEKCTVGELWIHRPWLHASEVLHHFEDGRMTVDSLATRFKDRMPYAWALEELALSKGITINEPYQGSQIGCFRVLSPSKDWYLNTLLLEFDKTPEAARVTESYLKQAFDDVIQRIMSFAEEKWDIETLREDVTTSADNESSVILYANIDNRGIFLCGDAGIRGLGHAADYAEALYLNLPNATFYQVPHHGGRHNVSPSVLNRIIGQILPHGTESNKTAFVSVGKGAERHPKKIVTNAFTRRGAKVSPTKGQTICSHHGTETRPGWTVLTPIPFHDEVESWE